MNPVIVIGGGPAGMMAAIEAAKNHSVLLIEKNEKLGKKLYITGKGRCNITNACEVEDFLKQVVRNPKFLYAALYTFPPSAMVEFLESYGCPTKVERGNRVFPVSDKASDVTKAFSMALERQGAQIHLSETVVSIERSETEFVVKTNKTSYKAKAVVIATGGVSYPLTGSTGDGYDWAKRFHHTVMPISGSLVPLVTREDVKPLQGLSLKNVGLTLYDQKKTLFKDQGELLFTHFGLSGPLVLSASSHRQDQKGMVAIDLKPGLSIDQLDKRVLRDFTLYANKDLTNGLVDLLPKSMIPYVIERAGLLPHEKIHQITKTMRESLIETIKHLSFTIEAPYDVKQAVITRGGVKVQEVDASTMASKKIPGLYFVGEVLDVDALTGGYNLQIAYATGYLAGCHIKEDNK